MGFDPVNQLVRAANEILNEEGRMELMRRINGHHAALVHVLVGEQEWSDVRIVQQS